MQLLLSLSIAGIAIAGILNSIAICRIARMLARSPVIVLRVKREVSENGRHESEHRVT